MTEKKIKVPPQARKVSATKAKVGSENAVVVEKPAKFPIAKVSKDVKAVVVNDKNGEAIREYSLKVHGDDFVKLASEFASKEEGREVIEK